MPNTVGAGDVLWLQRRRSATSAVATGRAGTSEDVWRAPGCVVRLEGERRGPGEVVCDGTGRRLWACTGDVHADNGIPVRRGHGLVWDAQACSNLLADFLAMTHLVIK